jgi:hypothetical protein
MKIGDFQIFSKVNLETGLKKGAVGMPKEILDQKRLVQLILKFSNSDLFW